MVIENYLAAVREDLGKVVGRVLFTGRHDTFVIVLLGKNMVGKVTLSLILYYCNYYNRFLMRWPGSYRKTISPTTLSTASAAHLLLLQQHSGISGLSGNI